MGYLPPRGSEDEGASPQSGGASSPKVLSRTPRPSMGGSGDGGGVWRRRAGAAAGLGRRGVGRRRRSRNPSTGGSPTPLSAPSPHCHRINPRGRRGTPPPPTITLWSLNTFTHKPGRRPARLGGLLGVAGARGRPVCRGQPRTKGGKPEERSGWKKSSQRTTSLSLISPPPPHALVKSPSIVAWNATSLEQGKESS